MTEKIPVQSLIVHIKTAVDVDQWAQDMAERLLSSQIPLPAEIEGDGRMPFWYYACGRCHGQVDTHDMFCKHCGGAIDWLPDLVK